MQPAKPKKNVAIQVAVRMRPLLLPYEDECAWTVDEPSNSLATLRFIHPFKLNSNLPNPLDLSPGNINPLLLRDRDLKRRFADTLQSYAFRFDNVFGQETNTQEIYYKVGRRVTKAVMQGYNGTVLVYGQTTSGKTYTMLGTPDRPGILPCALRDIFKGIQGDTENEYRINVSYLEVYNEIVNDLLVPGSTNLRIKEDAVEGVVVAGLKKVSVEDFQDAVALLNYGEEQRCYRETSVHEHSSRSHTIFKVYVEGRRRGDDKGPIRQSCLNLVDLAGSERLNEFDLKVETTGEAGFINKSLFVLTNVINRLAEGKAGYIPYRDSKLTRILSIALGGNSLTTIICTVSPAIMNFHQTLSTLRFATRAKVVENAPRLNEVLLLYVDESATVAQLLGELNKLKEQLHTKTEDVVRLERENQELKANSVEKTMEGMTRLKLTEAKEKYDTLQNKEANFMDNLVYFIDSLVHSTDASDSVDADKQDPRVDDEWGDETQRLVSLYKIELLTLQNKYRDSLRDLCTKYLHKNLPLIYAYLTTANAHERPIEEHSDAVISEIRSKRIFSAVTYDLESVVTQDFDMQAVATNDKELVVQLLDKVKDYKEHILEQLDEAYEGVKFRLESYYRNLIKKRKEQLASNIESTGEVSPAAALTKITNEHHEMLVATREQYEARMTKIEQDHQCILQKLMKSHGLAESEPEVEQKGKLRIPGLSQREGNIAALMKQQAVENEKLVLKAMPVVGPGRKMKAGENRRPAPA